jgi:dipeptidyl aminopeptidase/acylaminoacyl peptidase
MAQPFDTKRLELSGQAVPIAEQVAVSLGSNFSLAPNGSLAYRTGGGAGQQQLTWYDRQGKTLGAVADPYVYTGTSAPVLSPDGKRVAFTRTDPQSGNTDIWLFEFSRGVTTRFTFDPGPDHNPVWSPDGSRIVFMGQRGATSNIYQKASNLVGGEELVYKSPDVAVLPTSWSRDGKYVLYQTAGAGVWAVPMQGSGEGSGERKPIPLLPPEFNNRGARFSPDGRYFSYLSTESGRDETYVRTFDPTAGAGSATGGKSMVSKDGGGGAHWRADGKEMLYFAPDLTLMSVDVSTSPVFQAGVPKTLFKSSVASIYWESTGDGQRFLLPVAVGANTAAPYTVVLNWTSLLRR